MNAFLAPQQLHQALRQMVKLLMCKHQGLWGPCGNKPHALIIGLPHTGKSHTAAKCPHLAT